MKTLILMRHAKSTWDSNIKDDRDRSLSKRGRKAVPEMGDKLRSKDIIPDVILCSIAVRARQTADLLAEKMEYRGDIYFLNSLYMAEPETYVRQIQRIPEEFSTALVIGHNPGLEGLLQLMTGTIESLPTASIAQLQIQIDSWGVFSFEAGSELLHLWRPKNL